MKLAFLDTETTSLRHDRRAWEIGIIVRADDGTEVEHHWFIDADDLDLGNADLRSLEVGRFHTRHPQARTDVEYEFGAAEDEDEVMGAVERATRGTKPSLAPCPGSTPMCSDSGCGTMGTVRTVASAALAIRDNSWSAPPQRAMSATVGASLPPSRPRQGSRHD